LNNLFHHPSDVGESANSHYAQEIVSLLSNPADNGLIHSNSARMRQKIGQNQK